MAIKLGRQQLYIDGEWVDGSGDEELEVVNPATEEVIAHVPQASVADVDRAVAAARRAADGGPWPRMAPRERSDVLLRFVQAVIDRRAELVDLIIAEAGCTRACSRRRSSSTRRCGTRRGSPSRAASFPFLDPLPPQSSRGVSARA